MAIPDMAFKLPNLSESAAALRWARRLLLLQGRLRSNEPTQIRKVFSRLTTKSIGAGTIKAEETTLKRYVSALKERSNSLTNFVRGHPTRS